MATNLVVTSQSSNRSYRLLQPIGTWGADFSLIVFEAIRVPETNGPYSRVAIKVVGKDKSNYILAMDDIERMKSFVDPPPENILRPLATFNSQHNDVPIVCIVLPFDNLVSSLRSLMRSRPQFSTGIPFDCIAFVLNRVLVALNDIHFIDEFHNQLTAGNIFYDRRDREIKVSFASSVYERNPPEPEEKECSINTMLDWEELKNKTAAYIDRERPPKKRRLVIRIAPTGIRIVPTDEERERSFPLYFVQFVANCLATNPEDRMSVTELREHEFFKRHKVSLEYFEDVIVKGKTAAVARFMIQSRKRDSARNRKKPTLKESLFKKLQKSDN